MHSEDDIHYALEMTKVIHEPDRRIDTFGNTKFEFFLVSELMDQANVVRVRNGMIEAEKPLIIRPDLPDDFQMDGFGEEAQEFMRWMHGQLKDVALFKYGFRFRNKDVKEDLVHEPFEVVCGRLTEQVRQSGNPMQATSCSRGSFCCRSS